MSQVPAAFMSYVRQNDQHENRRLTEFRERLSGEVHLQTGEEFPIFQDGNNIARGEQWRQRIEELVDAATFLIPMLTPGFFRSRYCRAELERFLEREEQLGRRDLILPVYYVDCPILSDAAKREADPLATIIADRQRADWREFRFEPFTSPQVGKMIAAMAQQIVQSLERSAPLKPFIPKSATEAPGASAMPAMAAKGEGVPTPERGSAEPSDRIRSVSEKPKSYQAIMVSSTFTDLKHHRQQVIRAIEALGYRANVMEHDGARVDADVIDSSLQFVRDSAAYVGVISRKYGQTPYCPQRNPDRLSITELEFNEAMRLQRPILLFIMSEKHPVSEANIELDQDKRQKLGAFRQRARRIREGSEVERVYQVFDSLDQFSTAAFAAIGRLAESLRSEQIPGPERGPAGKNEPRTRIVDALHRGDHTTLTDALKAADPGDRILIRPGLYPEGVVIDKPVEIIGDGEPGEVVIEAEGRNTILFQANMARITNLTLRQTGGGNRYCVNIAQGRLDLEGCDITSQSSACVAIHDGADPRLRRNRIHDGKSGGIFVYTNGQGTLEDNDIFANALGGVEIKEGGNPTLRRNRIHDGKGQGVSVYENGQGTLEDNDIFANALGGVEISESSNPILRRNRIHDGKGQGVSVYENGQGTLEDNDIFANAFSGVVIIEGGNPTLRRNRIHDGNMSGVLVSKNGQGTLEDNEIIANARRGVEIREGGNPTLRRNRISENGYQAIFVHDGGGGVFEDNDLRGNTKGAWAIAKDCETKVTRKGNQE